MGAGGSAAVEIIAGHLRHLLVGTNPLNVDQLWDQMYSSAVLYGRRGIFAMALSAVDTALWDIKGKHAGRSVHALLGGQPDDRVAVYQTGGDNRRRQGPRHSPLQAHPAHRAPTAPRTKPTSGSTTCSPPPARRWVPEGNLMTDCVSRNGTVDWAVGVAERLRPAKSLLHGGAGSPPTTCSATPNWWRRSAAAAPAGRRWPVASTSTRNTASRCWCGSVPPRCCNRTSPGAAASRRPSGSPNWSKPQASN